MLPSSPSMDRPWRSAGIIEQAERCSSPAARGGLSRHVSCSSAVNRPGSPCGGEALLLEPSMTDKHLRLVYWTVTLVFALLQGWSAVQYLSEAPRMTETIGELGYPIYFMKILGVAKLMGI